MIYVIYAIPHISNRILDFFWELRVDETGKPTFLCFYVCLATHSLLLLKLTNLKYWSGFPYHANTQRLTNPENEIPNNGSKFRQYLSKYFRNFTKIFPKIVSEFARVFHPHFLKNLLKIFPKSSQILYVMFLIGWNLIYGYANCRHDVLLYFFLLLWFRIVKYTSSWSWKVFAK